MCKIFGCVLSLYRCSLWMIYANEYYNNFVCMYLLKFYFSNGWNKWSVKEKPKVAITAVVAGHWHWTMKSYSFVV